MSWKTNFVFKIILDTKFDEALSFAEKLLLKSRNLKHSTKIVEVYENS